MEKILEGNTENLNLEFKESFDFEESVWAREKLIRAILAMSNTKSGGFVIVGIKDNKPFDFVGVTAEHLNKFVTKIEELKAKVESFANFQADYEIGIGTYRKKRYLIFDIREFYLNPIICRKNGEHKDKILEEGAIYIRTLKDKPSSIKLINPVDVQDFMTRGMDKQITNYHKRGWRHVSEKSEDTSSLFEKERKGF